MRGGELVRRARRAARGARPLGVAERLVQQASVLAAGLRLAEGAVLAQAGELSGGAIEVGGVQLVAQSVVPGVSNQDLRNLAVDVRGRLESRGPAVVVLASPSDERGRLCHDGQQLVTVFKYEPPGC
jgi:hypothetical protein